jgi:hypothetical protein
MSSRCALVCSSECQKGSVLSAACCCLAACALVPLRAVHVALQAMLYTRWCVQLGGWQHWLPSACVLY